MFARLDLGKKLVALFLLMGVIPALVASLLAYRESSSALRTQSFNQLVAIRDIKMSQITDYFGFIEGQLTDLAANPTTVGALTDLETAYAELGAATARRLYITDNPHPAGEKLNLDDAKDGSAYSAAHARYHPVFHRFLLSFGYYDVFLVNEHGEIVYTVYKEDDFGTNLVTGKYKGENIGDAFRKALSLAQGKSALVDFKPYAPSAGAPASFIATPIFDHDGSRRGALIFQMPIDRINGVMQQRSGMGETGESYLIADDFLMRSDSFLDPVNHSVTASFKSPATGSVKSDAAKAALGGAVGSDIVIDYNGNPVLSAYAPLDLFGMKWAILAEIDEAEAFAAVTRLQWQVGGVLGVAVALIFVIGFFTARSISAPILNIIGELTEGSAQITSAAGQISTSSQALAEGATEQASALEESSAALEEISAQTKSNAANAVKANGVSSDATSAADEGARSVEEMIVAMGDINAASAEISKIIKVIEEIAFQTNLLALNAAVEAARAGEHGKGFAVVAEEVRNLAQRAAAAAKDTSALIANAVDKAASGAATADQAGTALERIVASIAQVSGLIGEIAAASQEQTTGVDQVSKAVTEMDKVTQSNASVAEEAAAAAEELNAQAESVNEIVQRLGVVINGADVATGSGQPAAPSRRIPARTQR